jgi:MoaA/NifB/PqqE/SkfB family radical SAM enzyme
MIRTFFNKTRAYLNFSKNILLSSFNGLPFPYKLTFAITSKCNLQCRTCYIWKKKSVNELSTEEMDRIFYKNNFFNWIDLTGGEIFLRKDLLEITRSIKKNMRNLVMLHYPTNGQLTEKITEITEKIASMDFNRLVLTVSLDGNEEIHNKIRNNKNAFKRCIQTYKELKRNKHINVYLGCTLSPFNLDYFPRYYADLREYIPDLQYSDIHLNIFHHSETLYSNEVLEFDKTKCLDTIENFIQKKRFHLINPIQLMEYVYSKNVKRYYSTQRIPFKCKAGRISCFIDPQGNVYPCTGYNVVLGNLRNYQYDLLQIRSQPDAQSLFRQISNGRCPHCWTPCEAYQNILSNLFIRRK